MSAKEKFDINKHKLIISLTDSYKLSRHKEYPAGTRFVNKVLMSMGTSFEDSDMQRFVVFGTSYAKKKLEELFYENFFNLDYNSVEEEMAIFVEDYIPGGEDYDFSHWHELHKYGSLPLEFVGVPEGSILSMGFPFLEIINTDERFFWLPDFIETIFLSYVWPCVASASRAFKVACMAVRAARKQGIDLDYYIRDVIPFQFHDFSMREQKGLDACEQTGMGHLCVFKGTDNMYAICSSKKYYNAGECDVIGKSIPTVEHSSTTSNIFTTDHGIGDEERYIMKLLTEVYPGVPVSYLCDSYDFWGFIARIMPGLKYLVKDCLPAGSKIVFRSDSGDPVEVLRGKRRSGSVSWKNSEKNAEKNGLIRCLLDVFGNEIRGISYLDSRVGIIHGGGMNYERISKILNFMVDQKVFVGSVSFGLGAVQQELYTRDNFGIVMKTTFIDVNGKEVDVYKNQKTSSGINKEGPRGRIYYGYDERSNSLTWADSSSEGIKACEDDFMWGPNFAKELSEIRETLHRSLRYFYDIMLK